MAGEPLGTCFYPGVNQCVGAHYSLNHGITPGLCTLDIVPQLGFIAEVGDLVWTFGGLEVFRLKNCRIDRSTLRYNPRGQVTQLALMDRRWRWQFGSLSGHYNLLRDDGSIEPTTQKSALALATLCFLAMGEPAFDVNVMPANAYPLVQWEAVNPAQALAALADQFGCRVCLPLSNVPRVVRLGDGAFLPIDQYVMEGSIDIDLPNRPDFIHVLGAKARHEVDLELIPVGKDTDGQYKPIDDLSYKPAGGWDKENFWTFSNVDGTIDPSTGLSKRDLAKQTVWRCYQVTGSNPVSPTLFVPGYGTITEQGKEARARILPLEDDMVRTMAYQGKPRSRPAEIYGIYWLGGNGFQESPSGTQYPKPFSIDKERGIVTFQERILRLIETGDNLSPFNVAPANILLRTAISVRDGITRAWNRYVLAYQFPGVQYGTGPFNVLREDLQINFWPVYVNNTPDKTAEPFSNQDEVEPQALLYIEAARLKFSQGAATTVKYNILRRIDVDGAIQQVVWQCGNGQGAVTYAARNNEMADQPVPPFKVRRLWELAANFMTGPELEAWRDFIRGPELQAVKKA